MQICKYDELLNENLDILKEIGSIGMGHASTALSQMLNMKITMTIPEVYALDYKAASEYLELQKKDSAGVILKLQGNAKGMILQVVKKKFAVKVINFFFHNDLEIIDELDEMSLSVIQEIGNITSGAYCNALASMTNLFIDISTPTHCPDLTKAILEDEYDQNKENKLLILNNSLFIDNEEIKSNFLFMPDEKTITMILEKLKEYYGFKS